MGVGDPGDRVDMGATGPSLILVKVVGVCERCVLNCFQGKNFKGEGLLGKPGSPERDSRDGGGPFSGHGGETPP